MLKHQNGFDQTGQAKRLFSGGRGWFHRPSMTRNCSIPDDPAQGVHNACSIRSPRPSCSVRFHKPDLRRAIPAFCRPPARGRLRLDAGREIPVGMPILINCRPDDHCVDRVTLDGLERRRDPFAIPASPRTKPLATRRTLCNGRQAKASKPAKIRCAALRDHHGHGARESRVTVPRPNMFTSSMHRRQGRGTERCQRNAWSAC
jgi:hypothetical protein